MKEGKKLVQPQPADFNYFSSDLPPCKKHPSNPSSVGICPYCLNERLMKLICSDCGEHRLSSSCCCSDASSYRNSSCTVGSVGRISFLIENEKGDHDQQHHKTLFSHMNQIKKGGGGGEKGDIVLLKRSNSCVVEVKKSNGFWRIGKLFKKRREKEGCSERSRGGFGFDHKDEEVWAMDVSRSRSLSSFIDGSFDHDEVGGMAFSSAKVSDINESEPVKSGFGGGFSAKEADFGRMVVDGYDDDDDDSEFIDLKLDLSDKLTTEDSVIKTPDLIGSSSCRITVDERGIKKVKNNHMKALKWIFNHHSGKKDVIIS